MQTDDQPLDREPQEADDFNSAFDEFAGGERDDKPRSTDADFDEGEQLPEEVQGSESDSADDQDDADAMTERERELQEQLERLRHSEASQRGRLGAYQRQINELQRQVQGRQQAARQAPQQDDTIGEGASDDQQRQDMASAMGSDDWQTFAEDFPDMARALETRLHADRQERAQLEQRLAEYEPALQSIQQQAHEQHLQVQEDALSARHPDWREVVAAPAFVEWLNQQPESLQRLTASDDAAEAAALLDLYRSHTGAAGPAESRTGTPDRRQQRLAAAQSVGRRGAPRKAQVADDFDAAFDHYAAKSGAR